MTIDIKSKFTFHIPDQRGVEKMRMIRYHVRLLAQQIEELCPESPEKHEAIISLQTTMMLANSSIVQCYPTDPFDEYPASAEYNCKESLKVEDSFGL